MRKLLIGVPAMVSLALLLSACDKKDSGKLESTPTQSAVLISVTRAATTDLEIWLGSVGQMHSLSAPTLAAEVDGRITMVSADTGDSVEAGQLLATIDTSTLLLQRQAALAGVERLQAHVANGEVRVARFESLSSRDLSSQTQLDDARERLDAYRADYKAAQAQLAIVDDALRKSRVTAPVSGELQRRLISEGDFVKRGQALFKITRPKLLQAWLAYPETAANRIRQGQVVEVRSPVASGKVFKGVISELQPAIGPGSRALTIITDIENPGDLRPEATISGRVLVEVRKQVTVVPEISVVRRPAGPVVYVINNNQAEARLVTIGQRENGQVEIITGVQSGETVATDGAAFLTDGATVKISEHRNESS